MAETHMERMLRLSNENVSYGGLFVIQERDKGRKEFLKEIRCEHYDGEKCTLFNRCTFPNCRWYVTVEEC